MRISTSLNGAIAKPNVLKRKLIKGDNMKTFSLKIEKNLLKTREDVVISLNQLLKPCQSKFVLGNTGLFSYNGSTVYSDRVGLFEGWSRLLWGIGPMLYGGYEWEGFDKIREGLINGTNPDSEYYWGEVKDGDQRIVEMAAIALLLLLNKDKVWNNLAKWEKYNIYTWLNKVNYRKFSDNNWKFFRVLVNLAFEHLGLPFEEAMFEHDLDLIESFYVSDGWYKDSAPFDNYNPFAIQYYSMIYYYFRKDKDVKRCQKYKERVFEFAKQHITYLTNEGLYVPYGRSLAYRFAVVSFYSSCAFAGLEVLPWGVMKGIILRNLRWWFSQPIFDREGMLTVGFRYPNLMISEQYNGQGSPYWSFKTFIILALKENHPFWSSEELPLPKLPQVTCLKVPGTLMCRTSSDDVVLLNAGQYPIYQMNHAADKYSKFAYSAHFGFSTSISNYDFEKLGCDSMLYVSLGDGYWYQRRKVEVLEVSQDYLKTAWSPLKGVNITTWLFPAGDGHVRIHKIDSSISLLTKEGGFAIASYNGFELEEEKVVEQKDIHDIKFSYSWATSLASDLSKKRKAAIIKPCPNLNYMASCVEVPYLEGTVKEAETIYYCGLFAASRSNNFVIPPVSFCENTLLFSIGEKQYRL